MSCFYQPFNPVVAFEASVKTQSGRKEYNTNKRTRQGCAALAENQTTARRLEERRGDERGRARKDEIESSTCFIQARKEVKKGRREL